jgi:hypothetical protein
MLGRVLCGRSIILRTSVILVAGKPLSFACFFVWRGRLPQILLGQERIIVAPQQEMYELACTYAAQQRDFGNVDLGSCALSVMLTGYSISSKSHSSLRAGASPFTALGLAR